MLVALLAVFLWVIRYKYNNITSAEAAQNVFTVVYRLGIVIINYGMFHIIYSRGDYSKRIIQC